MKSVFSAHLQTAVQKKQPLEMAGVQHIAVYKSDKERQL